MRARSIKPSICDNEILGTADPLYTLLFERLWMMADRAGRLEDRPLRIKAQAFPYRDGLDVEPMLQWLHEQQFILRYQVDGQRYIQVMKFAEHQSPHIKEAPSKIPAPDEHHTSTVQAPEIPATTALTPSSLTPDSRLLTPDCVSSARAPEDGGEFNRVKAAYPRFSGRQDWITAEHHCRLRVDRDGASWSDLLGAVERYRAYCDGGGVSGPQYVMTPAKFFSAADEPWKQPWTIPPNKAEIRQGRNISASEQWLREQEANDAAH